MMTLPRRLLVLAALLGGGGACRPARAPGAGGPHVGATDSAEAHAAALRYLDAFDSLQLDAVLAGQSPDVMTFMPGGRLPWRRLEGRAALEAQYRRMFDAVRARAAREAPGAAPTLGVGPQVRDLRVYVAGPGVAVVSFHLGEGETPGRRTFGFRREGDAVWRVVHSHASNPPPPRAP